MTTSPHETTDGSRIAEDQTDGETTPQMRTIENLQTETAITMTGTQGFGDTREINPTTK